MKSILCAILVVVLCISHLNAFVPSKASLSPVLTTGRIEGVLASSKGDDSDGADFTHGDIVWKLRPPEGTSRRERLKLRIAANLLRLDSFLFRKDLPFSLCPKGGEAMLEAHTKDAKGKLVKVGRFGFTTERGPHATPIQDTLYDVYGISTLAGVAAIKYMFVEPDYRKRKIGTLALDVIRTIHTIQGCDFSLLVVDDDGSGKLVDWYEKNGYSKAPKLQNILGSPDAANGISMIGPTNVLLDEACRLKWW